MVKCFLMLLLLFIGCGSKHTVTPGIDTAWDYTIIDDKGIGADGINFIETESEYILLTPWQESNDVRICVSPKNTEFVCESVGEALYPEWVTFGEGMIVSFGLGVVNHTLATEYDVKHSGTWAAGAFVDSNLTGVKDIVAGSQSGKLVIFDIAGNILFQTKHDDTIMQIDILDMNKDGVDDIVVFDRSTIGYYSVPDLIFTSLYEDKDNSLRGGEVFPDYLIVARATPPNIIEITDEVKVYAVGENGYPKDVAIGDINNSGRLDFIVTSYAGSTYYLEDKVKYVEINKLGKKADNIILYDFTGNGNLDVMTSFEIPNLGVLLFINK